MFQIDIIKLLIRVLGRSVLCRYTAAHTHYVTLLTKRIELIIYAYLSVASINPTDARGARGTQALRLPHNYE
jgi:hypothetical protein